MDTATSHLHAFNNQSESTAMRTTTGGRKNSGASHSHSTSSPVISPYESARAAFEHPSDRSGVSAGGGGLTQRRRNSVIISPSGSHSALDEAAVTHSAATAAFPPSLPCSAASSLQYGLDQLLTAPPVRQGSNSDLARSNTSSSALSLNYYYTAGRGVSGAGSSTTSLSSAVSRDGTEEEMLLQQQQQQAGIPMASSASRISPLEESTMPLRRNSATFSFDEDQTVLPISSTSTARSATLRRAAPSSSTRRTIPASPPDISDSDQDIDGDWSQPIAKSTPASLQSQPTVIPPLNDIRSLNSQGNTIEEPYYRSAQEPESLPSRGSHVKAALSDTTAVPSTTIRHGLHSGSIDSHAANSSSYIEEQRLTASRDPPPRPSRDRRSSNSFGKHTSNIILSDARSGDSERPDDTRDSSQHVTEAAMSNSLRVQGTAQSADAKTGLIRTSTNENSNTVGATSHSDSSEDLNDISLGDEELQRDIEDAIAVANLSLRETFSTRSLASPAHTPFNLPPQDFVPPHSMESHETISPSPQPPQLPLHSAGSNTSLNSSGSGSGSGLNFILGSDQDNTPRDRDHSYHNRDFVYDDSITPTPPALPRMPSISDLSITGQRASPPGMSPSLFVESSSPPFGLAGDIITRNMPLPDCWFVQKAIGNAQGGERVQLLTEAINNLARCHSGLNIWILKTKEGTTRNMPSPKRHAHSETVNQDNSDSTHDKFSTRSNGIGLGYPSRTAVNSSAMSTYSAEFSARATSTTRAIELLSKSSNAFEEASPPLPALPFPGLTNVPRQAKRAEPGPKGFFASLGRKTVSKTADPHGNINRTPARGIPLSTSVSSLASSNSPKSIGAATTPPVRKSNLSIAGPRPVPRPNSSTSSMRYPVQSPRSLSYGERSTSPVQDNSNSGVSDAALERLTDILPQADRRVLEQYLISEGTESAAISRYVAEEKMKYRSIDG